MASWYTWIKKNIYIYLSIIYNYKARERERNCKHIFPETPSYFILTSSETTRKLTRSEATIWRTQAGVPVATEIATRPWPWKPGGTRVIIWMLMLRIQTDITDLWPVCLLSVDSCISVRRCFSHSLTLATKFLKDGGLAPARSRVWSWCKFPANPGVPHVSPVPFLSNQQQPVPKLTGDCSAVLLVQPTPSRHRQ